MAILGFIIFALIIWSSIFITGKMLPSTYKVERTKYIDAPPSMLWSIIANHLKEKDWRNDLREVVKVGNQGEKPVWKEVRRDNKSFNLKTTLTEAPHRLEREIVDNKVVGGLYHYEIVPEEDGSRLIIKQTSKISSPYQRVKLFLLPSSKYAFIEQYLSDVKQRVLHLKEEE